MRVRAVAFDLGGVLVEVCHTWEDALSAAGFAPPHVSGPLATAPGFEDYQGGRMAEAAYLSSLAAHLGFGLSQAALVHRAILRSEYPGVSEVVDGLKASGVVTGCLSNTNALHWSDLVSPERFPTVAGLLVKTASHEVGSSKPDPLIYTAFERAVGATKDEILYFDDVPEFVACARARGWSACLVRPEEGPAVQIERKLRAEGLL